MKFKKLIDKQKIAWKLLKAQQHTSYMFDGGSRAGKTFVIVLFCIILCMSYPGIRILMARLRFSYAKSSIWLQTLLPLLKDNFDATGYIINNSDYIVRFNNGSEIWLGGLDDKERTEKVLGQEYACIFLNEAVRIPLSSRDIVLTRLAQKIKDFKNFVIYDCNPRHPLHYLYQEFYVEKDKNRAELHWIPQDNIENIADNYIENILEKFKGNKRKRFLKGEWAALPGGVYPGIKAENIIDVNKDFMYYDDVCGGIDFGLYSAVNIWGFKEDRAYCIYEIILLGSKDTTTKNIIKEIDKIKEVKFYDVVLYCDHEPDRIEELCEAGYMAKKAYKDVSAGDSSVNEKELFFDKKCQNTFQSMLNLVNQQDNNDNYIDKHVKENDHEADGGRYGIHGYKKDNSSVNAHFFGGGV